MGSMQHDGGGLKRVESYQWPSAHIGHLSEGQQRALEKFKQLSADKGYYAFGDGETPPTHDDETLLRYLRARKFIPQEAFTQFKETEDWRKENQLDLLYETIDVNEYDQTRRLYPQWTGRRDKRGIPLYVFEVANVEAKAVAAQDNVKNNKTQFSGKTPHRMMRLFALYENLCRFVLPLCSAIPDRPHAETPISQSNNIVDISKVGFAKFWSLRNHMSDASKLATAYYPETLDRIFVVGSPSFFPTVWEWAKRWFDPITVSKIFILSEKNMAATLSQYVNMDDIPKKYGGNLDWKFGDMPYLDAGIAKALQWRERADDHGRRTLPIGPIKWQYDEPNGHMVATAIGTENKKARQMVIAGLPATAGVTRLALNPGRADKALTHIGAAASKPPAVALSDGIPNGTPNGNMSYKDSDLSNGKTPGSGVQETSRAGTYTVPFRDQQNDVVKSSREGTSSTRFEQQHGTHAADQMANGTPAMKVDGHGVEQGIMEPNTVGQAPKEHPVPNQDVMEPTMVEKAQHAAGQAYETAAHIPQQLMSAVGMGGKQDDKVEHAVERKADPEVDNMDSKNVEEFLRQKTMSV